MVSHREPLYTGWLSVFEARRPTHLMYIALNRHVLRRGGSIKRRRRTTLQPAALRCVWASYTVSPLRLLCMTPGGRRWSASKACLMCSGHQTDLTCDVRRAAQCTGGSADGGAAQGQHLKWMNQLLMCRIACHAQLRTGGGGGGGGAGGGAAHGATQLDDIRRVRANILV